MTSAHRAKGLEFDHVVILDGRWNAASDAEDPDTSRRLYYVSMTRARETLALVRLDDARRSDVRDTPLRAKREERAASLLQPLGNDPSVLEREVPRPDISDRRLDIRIAECTMKDVVLSFAGCGSQELRVERRRREGGHCARAQWEPRRRNRGSGLARLLDAGGSGAGAWVDPVGRPAERFVALKNARNYP